MELRHYQEKSVDAIRVSIKSGHKRPLLAQPTGAGKSLVFGKIINSIANNGKTVLWIVHRRNLVFQMQEVLKKFFDVDAGIIMAGVPSDTGKNVQLCTIQSYGRRVDIDAIEYNRFFIDADVVLVDEAHRSISRTYQSVLGLYKQKNKIIVGCTATPMRADGRGLGEVYDDLIDVIGIRQLIEEGYLSPIRYFVPSIIDLDGVKISMGDYQIQSLEKKVNRPKIVGDIVENWLKIAKNRKTLVYCVNVKHSISVCEAFRAAGVRAEHLDAKSTDDEREAVFNAMQRGDIDVLTNVYLYTEGLDVPSVSCIYIARPTKSMGAYRQMAGRGLRVEDGKEDCLLLDGGNIVQEHGLLEWDVEWTLDGKEKAWKKPTREVTAKVVRCRACGLVFEGSNVCPDCGTAVKSFGQSIPTIDAELEEIESKKPKVITEAEKRIFYGMLRAWVPKQKNPNPKRIAGAFKGKYNEWPNGYENVAPIEPDKGFLNYMKYQAIKFAKRRER